MKGKVKIEIPNELGQKIYKKFKKESGKIVDLLYTLEDNPNKGKFLARIGTLLLKELKYKSFRVYFFLDGNKLYLFNEEKLKEILIRFLEMSKKNDQKQTIETLKKVLEELEK